MIRKTLIMSVCSGGEAEYERRHQPISPELGRVFKAHDAHHYSVFLHRPFCQLIAYVEVEDEARWGAIERFSECRHRWKSIEVIMPYNRDGTPEANILAMVETVKES